MTLLSAISKALGFIWDKLDDVSFEMQLCKSFDLNIEEQSSDFSHVVFVLFPVIERSFVLILTIALIRKLRINQYNFSEKNGEREREIAFRNATLQIRIRTLDKQLVLIILVTFLVRSTAVHI